MSMLSLTVTGSLLFFDCMRSNCLKFDSLPWWPRTATPCRAKYLKLLKICFKHQVATFLCNSSGSVKFTNNIWYFINRSKFVHSCNMRRTFVMFLAKHSKAFFQLTKPLFTNASSENLFVFIPWRSLFIPSLLQWSFTLVNNITPRVIKWTRVKKMNYTAVLSPLICLTVWIYLPWMELKWNV